LITRRHIWLCRIAASVTLGVLAVAFYMAVDREPPYVYLEGDVFPLDPPAGSQVAIHWHVHAKRYCPGWVERTITDQRGYLWRNIGGPVRPNAERDSHIVNTIDLPRGLSGPAHYQAHVCYRCNPLHKFWPICVHTPVLPFTIH
jgi:hypothetical protein